MRYNTLNTLEVNIKYTMNKLRVLFYTRLLQTKICVENIVKDFRKQKRKEKLYCLQKVEMLADNNFFRATQYYVPLATTNYLSAVRYVSLVVA